MTNLIIILLESSVCLILFYGFYLLLMSNSTHFQLNRVFLLSATILSLIIPMLSIPVRASADGGSVGILLQTIQISQEETAPLLRNFDILQWLAIIYIAGCSIFLLRFLYKLWSLMRIRRSARIEAFQGVQIAWHNMPFAPFSFGRTIFLSQEMKKTPQLSTILIHERAHIRQAHTLDLMALELACILIWFNPAVWMIKFSLKENHEYLADDNTTRYISDRGSYFNLLIKIAFGQQPGLASNLNKSLTLKRLKMMKKNRSGKAIALKPLLALPLITLMILAFSCKQNQIEPISDAAVGAAGNVIVSNYDSGDVQGSDGKAEKDESAYKTIDNMPSFKGGNEKLTAYIISQVKYPAEAKKNGIQGTVYVSFVVTTTGKVEEVMVLKKVNDLLDKEAYRVISNMPDWNPGTSKGVPVEVSMTLPISFKLGDKN